MANIPNAPTRKSLQINIDSEDDVKAVIQHLQEIKRRWDMLQESGLVDSIEFCVAEPLRRKVDDRLMTAVRWCTTFFKSVAPFEGNVFFPLPHFVPPPVDYPKQTVKPAAEPAAPAKPEKVNRYLRNLPAQPETPGNPKRLVTAETAGT